MVAEVAAGLLADSLALLSDAAHMLTDAGVARARAGRRAAGRPAAEPARFTFGLGRAEILSAQVNGAALLVLAGVIAIEAVQRLILAAGRRGRRGARRSACSGAVRQRRRGVAARAAERRSLNVEGARAHVLTDLYASLGGGRSPARSILLTGFDEADPLAALLVAVADGALGLERCCATPRRVLLEGSPEGVRTEESAARSPRAPGIVEVHDLHVWEVTSGFPALAAHVLVRAGRRLPRPPARARAAAPRALRDRAHTLQVDHEPREQLLEIESPSALSERGRELRDRARRGSSCSWRQVMRITR